jgi:hypothetical protein
MAPHEIGPQTESRVTRGICTACREHFAFQMGVPLQTYLDSLPVPIFVVDGDAVVQAANKQGYRTLQKGPDQVLKRLSGVVFECAYARLPAGCGRTVHCSGCAIRRSIAHTYETGESLYSVPASLHCGGEGGSHDVSLSISTEMMGNVVLLRLEYAARALKA